MIVVREPCGYMKSRSIDLFIVKNWDSFRELMMTYDEKVKLYNANRYLMPLPPLGTRNWTVRDYIRYIDQHGRWCPDNRDQCELYGWGTLNSLQSSFNRIQVRTCEYCPHYGNILAEIDSKCPICGYWVLCRWRMEGPFIRVSKGL